MPSVKDDLSARGLLKGVLLSPSTEAMLGALQVVTTASETTPGTVTLGLAGTPLFLDLNLAPFTTTAEYTVSAADGGFVVVVDLSKLGPIAKVLEFADAGAGAALTPADAHDDGAGQEWLTAQSDESAKVAITGIAPQLRITGKPGAIATMRIAPSAGQPPDIVRLGLAPDTVMLGSSGFGLQLMQGFLIDDSDTAAPAVDPPAMIDGKTLTLPGDTPGWRGISVRNARFFLPDNVPFFGRTAVDAQLEIGVDPPGVALSITAKAPATSDRGAMTVRIDCVDPSATGLGSLAPTLVEATLEIPADQHHVDTDAGPLVLAAGKPLIARARFLRDPTDPDRLTRVSVALEAQGPNGILHIDGKGAAARGLVAAGAFGTILLSGDGAKQGGTVTALLVAGGLLSSLLDDGGSLTVNSVELESSGHGVPVTGPFHMRVDYSVDVVVRPLDIGVLKVGLDPAQPLRVRVRGVVLSVNPAKPGLEKFDLDFKHAEMDVEDPGRWLIGGPDSLFDVLGSRSGHGSIWLEVDLRFKLNLGPIKVSGATVRATLDTSNGSVAVSLRGLDVSLSLPGLLSGSGSMTLIEPEPGAHGPGFSARLDAKLIPLGLTVDAYITVEAPMILLGIGVDLPGPIPLGPTGLGLFGIGGNVGIAARIELPDEPAGDVVRRQLSWRPINGFAPESGAFSLGLQVVVGTLADDAFAFSAKAGLFLTLPDPVVLGALDAQFMQGRQSIADDPGQEKKLAAFRGIFSVSREQGVAFALLGELSVPMLLDVKIPVAGKFPAKSNDWYIYVGADGYGLQDRGIGPATVSVLPDIFPQTASGYLMLRGQGIQNWPRGGQVSLGDGYVVAFGFSKEFFFGKKKIVWAEASGGVDILVATNPLIIAGFGHIDGSLHIGPASLGVSAKVTAFITKDGSYVTAKVCGRIRLLFIKVEKCATLRFGGQIDAGIPVPPALPIAQMGQDADGNPVVLGDNVSVIDDRYRRLFDLSRDAASAQLVWPDALIRIGFATAPKLAPGFAPQFDAGLNTGPQAQPIGSSFLKYEWTLLSLNLLDVTDGDEVAIAVPPLGLSAAWQSGKAGDADTLAQPSELVLLTPDANLWLNRMADGGVTAAGDPLGALGNACHARADSKPGWTIGYMAASGGMEWWLPPEMLSTDPLQSRVEGRCWFGRDRPGVGFLVFDALPSPVPTNYSFSDAFTYDTPFKFGRPFPGGLRLPMATSIHADDAATQFSFEAPIVFDALIVLDDMLVDGGHVLLFCRTSDSALLFERRRPVVVSGDKDEWPMKIKAAKNGLLLDFAMPPGEVTTTIRIRWVATEVVTLLGIVGVTATAAAAAATKQAKLDAEAAKNAAVADAPPPDTDDNAGPAQRCLLEAGRTYRLDLAFKWSAWLYEQAESGQPREKQKLLDQTDYAPPGSDDPLPATASFFFRTAADPHADGGSDVPQLPAYGTAEYLPAVSSRQDVFAPAMLARYLAGYTPAQSEVDRFRDDPLHVHFSVSHAAALAARYAYELVLAVRRVDVGGAANTLFLPKITLQAPATPEFLTGRSLQQFIVAKAADCPVPVPGMDMATGALGLEPRAWYEAYVRADYTAGGVTPTPLPAALRGITFRTSRWRDPADMLAGIGFPKTAASTHTGDLPVTPVALASARGDGAFDAALDALGLHGWPLAPEPRISLLWTHAADVWLLAGVLVESPEPVDRPDRCEVALLSARNGVLPPAAAFTTQIFDRTGSRLLFLADSPFVPRSWIMPAMKGKKIGVKSVQHASITLKLVDHPPGSDATVSISGSITLPSRPQFASEAF